MISKSLTKKLTMNAGLFNKRKPTPKDLDSYDVVVVGCNLGGIFSQHFDHITHGAYKSIMAVDSNINEITAMRQGY